MKNNEFYIKKCIELAEQSVKKGEAPFGSLIVKNGKIIVKVTNANEKKCDVTSHAEIMAMRKAQKKLKSKDLKDCEIYSNCEPCPMCSFMMRELHFKKVVFGVRSPNMGGKSKWNILQDKGLSKIKPFFSDEPEVVGGVLEKECKETYTKIGWGDFLEKL
ncbi:MAG: nucleoside deaminase [Candidatus Shapirobacteria bacterium]|nr:nucleoside deaminase [Candidatus Shapirobacteria bacterium]MDD4382817.1 nucleoside deaminase [Candidatus Shapirobacteria bacterium]